MERETARRETEHDDDAWPTADELAEMVPAQEFFAPETFASLERARGRPKAATVKTPVTMRIDPDTLAAFKATGRGWQSRMNEVLRQAAVGGRMDPAKSRKPGA